MKPKLYVALDTKFSWLKKSLHEITNHLQVIPVYKVDVWQQPENQDDYPCRKASLL